MSYRTSVLWGRCPALTQLLQLITPSRASGTADHVRSLDDLLPVGKDDIGSLFLFESMSMYAKTDAEPQVVGAGRILNNSNSIVFEHYKNVFNAKTHN